MARAQKPNALLARIWHWFIHSSIIVKIVIGLLIAIFVVPLAYTAYNNQTAVERERSDTKHIEKLAITYFGADWTNSGTFSRSCQNVSHSMVETGEFCTNQQDLSLYTFDARDLMARYIREFEADGWKFGLPGEDVPSDKLTVLQMFLDGKADHWQMRFSRQASERDGTAGTEEVLFSDAETSIGPKVAIKASVRYKIER